MAAAESCHSCVYAQWDLGLWVRTLWSGFPARPSCGNHPDYPGRMRECPPGTVCRNFRPRPPTPTGPTVKTIPLGDGFYTYVDAADFEWLNQWTWHLHSGYAMRRENGKYIYMHRQIMQPPEGMIVDHQNRNRLDNTRPNLRVCTKQENACNYSKRRGTSSRFRGVRFRKDCGKYRADVFYKGQNYPCGYFADELAAARARDHKAVQVLGERARLNFPEDWPPQRCRRVHAQWLRTQARQKAEVPRAKSRGSKHGNRKDRIVNTESKALRAHARPKVKRPPEKPKRSARSAPKKPTRKRRKATSKRKQTGKRRSRRRGPRSHREN
jgi:hypothetical protein